MSRGLILFAVFQISRFLLQILMWYGALRCIFFQFCWILSRSVVTRIVLRTLMRLAIWVVILPISFFCNRKNKTREFLKISTGKIVSILYWILGLLVLKRIHLFLIIELSTSMCHFYIENELTPAFTFQIGNFFMKEKEISDHFRAEKYECSLSDFYFLGILTIISIFNAKINILYGISRIKCENSLFVFWPSIGKSNSISYAPYLFGNSHWNIDLVHLDWMSRSLSVLGSPALTYLCAFTAVWHIMSTGVCLYYFEHRNSNIWICLLFFQKFNEFQNAVYSCVHCSFV